MGDSNERRNQDSERKRESLLRSQPPIIAISLHQVDFFLTQGHNRLFASEDFQDLAVSVIYLEEKTSVK